MIVCVCWRIWKEEGGGGGTHVMFEFNLIVNFQKNKTFFCTQQDAIEVNFVIYDTGNGIWRQKPCTEVTVCHRE